jgi:hypothetical protein
VWVLIDHRSPVDHERHAHKFGNARLMFVRVHFDRFCVAVSARIVAHCFRAAFVMDVIYREIRREQTRAAFFFSFELSPRSKGQCSIEPEIRDESGNRLAIRRHLSCDREVLELIARGGLRTRPKRSDPCGADRWRQHHGKHHQDLRGQQAGETYTDHAHTIFNTVHVARLRCAVSGSREQAFAEVEGVLDAIARELPDTVST